jgi:hypothetical protein
VQTLGASQHDRDDVPLPQTFCSGQHSATLGLVQTSFLLTRQQPTPHGLLHVFLQSSWQAPV